MKAKNIKNYSSILAMVNHRNWLDDSPPLTSVLKAVIHLANSSGLQQLKLNYNFWYFLF